MRDVIQKIVATENQAKRIVEEGRVEADRILSEARKKAQYITTKAYQDAGKEAQDIVAEATQAAERERQDSLQRASEAIEREIVIDKDLRKAIIEEILRHVCGRQSDVRRRIE